MLRLTLLTLHQKLCCITLQTVRKGSWQQLHFKGDPMHRPVTSREIGFLVRWLVWLSVWLNSRMGLDQPVQEHEMSESLFQVSSVLLCMQLSKAYHINLGVNVCAVLLVRAKQS